ncbi:MAG TPA: hypothetical protein VMP01_17600 [Pirellulaceae bacterium]|nr:hypothetical protein [Pirellulaceae bacterium]
MDRQNFDDVRAIAKEVHSEFSHHAVAQSIWDQSEMIQAIRNGQPVKATFECLEAEAEPGTWGS